MSRKVIIFVLHTIVGVSSAIVVGIGILLAVAAISPDNYPLIKELNPTITYWIAGIVTGVGIIAYVLQQYIPKWEETPPDDTESLGGDFEAYRLSEKDQELDNFIGRENEIEKLENFLLKGPPESTWAKILRLIGSPQKKKDSFVAVISGIGGIGKTTLALKVASSENIRQKYSGGCYMIEMKGLESNQNQTTAEALLYLIRKIDPKIILPDDTDEEALRQNYNRVLEKSPRLILLDNPGERIELEEFTPPKNCGLLIITRPHISCFKNVRVKLNPFTLKEAKKLLKDRSQRNDMSEATAEMICQLCGCLPLAVKAAGTYLSSNERKSAEQYARELETEYNKELGQHSIFLGKIGKQGVKRDIPTTFKLSYQLLNTNESKQLFRYLGVFPSSFTAESTNAIMQKIVSDAQVNWTESLELLNHYGLIEQNQDSSRYYLFDLLRLYARLLFKEENENTLLAYESFVDYYIGIAQKASQKFNEEGDDGVEIFCDELSNLWATFHWLVGNDSEHPRDMKRVRQLVEASIKIIDSNTVKNDNDEDIQKGDVYFSLSEYNEWLQAGLATLRPDYDQLNNAQKKIFARLCVFVDWFDLKAAKAVTECRDEQVFNILVQRELLYQRADDQWYSLPNLSVELALKEIGTEYNPTYLRYVDYFIDLAVKIESLYTSRPDEFIVILRKNLFHIRTVLNWAEEKDARRFEKMLLAISPYHGHEFKFEELEKWFESWQTTATNKVEAKNRLGEIYLHSANYPKAQKLFNESLALAKKNNNQSGQVNALFGLGCITYQIGNSDKAKIDLNKVLAIDSNHSETLMMLAGIYAAEGNFLEAKKRYEQLLHADIGLYNQATVYRNLAVLEESRGNVNEALSMAQKSLDIVNQYDIFVLKESVQEQIEQLEKKKQRR